MRGKSYWEKGGGEVAGFLCIVPFIIFMLAALITAVQIGSIKERLEYAAYKACRAAVVCKDTDRDGDFLDDAQKLAQQAAEADFDLSQEVYRDGSVKAKVELVGNGGTQAAKWEKGSYVRCTVSVYVKAPVAFMSGRRSSSIVMMIENPANEGGGYPWFRDL